MKPPVEGPVSEVHKGSPKPASAGFKGLVEFSPQFAPRPDISHVLFDFDGTTILTIINLNQKNGLGFKWRQ